MIIITLSPILKKGGPHHALNAGRSYMSPNGCYTLHNVGVFPDAISIFGALLAFCKPFGGHTQLIS